MNAGGRNAMAEKKALPLREAQKYARSFPVVCIGMSAGAVKPLKELFEAISPNTGMAFIVVHHLHKIPTLLPQILAKCTEMTVQLASPGQELKPNYVYILPSGQELTIADGCFLVGPRTKLRGWTNVFTLLLDSLSKSPHQGIAVVLSGLDEDGAAALEKFNETGGITIVQAPKSAERPEMPEAAIQTGLVDYVLAPVAIAAELEKIAATFRNHSARAAAK